MNHGSRRRWTAYLVAFAGALVAMGLVWTAAPEDVRGLLLLVGAATWGMIILVGYALERRLHW